MPHLEVAGASLYYEVVGRGPLLLCISGGDGTTEIWRGFAEGLEDRFTVVAWNRRGFGRSHLTAAQDYSQRLETDADDAARLLQHFLPSGEPANVIGNSSGAIIALKLLSRHPQLIRTLISYEPPLARLLPDFDEIWATHEDIYTTYRASGMLPAWEKFAKLVKIEFPPGAIAKMAQNTPERPYAFSNMLYWFEREFMTYPQAQWNIETELEPQKAKLVLFNGELSHHEAYQYRGNVALGQKLGLEVLSVPGEHTGHASHARGFGEKVVEVLRERDGGD